MMALAAPHTTKVTTAKATNKDLPQQLTDNDVWAKKIVPTMICWFSAQASPWVPADVGGFETALELVCCHFSGDDYQLSDGTNSPEFQVVRFTLSSYTIANKRVAPSTIQRCMAYPYQECRPLMRDQVF